MVLILSSSCVSKKAPKQSIQSFLLSSYYSLEYSEFNSEIALKEEKLFEEDSMRFSGKEQAKLLIQLVILYSHKNNPKPDFVMALKYLKQYALLHNQVSIEYVEALLDIMVENTLEYDILKNRYEKSLKEKKKLMASYSRLVAKVQDKEKALQEKSTIIQENAEEIKKKNEIIEKLKALDIKLENRRADTD